MYVSVYFLAPEVQNRFHWCLVLGICFRISQMNLILLYIGCAENKAQTEIVILPKGLVPYIRSNFITIFSFYCKHFWVW